jgi:hypothetical protein
MFFFFVKVSMSTSILIYLDNRLENIYFIWIWYVWNNRNIVGLYTTITFFSQGKFIIQAQTLVVNFVKAVIKAYRVYILVKCLNS